MRKCIKEKRKAYAKEARRREKSDDWSVFIPGLMDLPDGTRAYANSREEACEIYRAAYERATEGGTHHE